MWVLTAEVLFDVAKSDLDGPTPGVAGRYLGAGVGEVAGDEEVVAFDAVRVADDDEADQAGLLDGVPEHVTDVDESVDVGAALVDGDVLPLVGSGPRGKLCANRLAIYANPRFARSLRGAAGRLTRSIASPPCVRCSTLLNVDNQP